MALPLSKLRVRQRIVEVGWYRQVWKLSKPARHGLNGHELGDGRPWLVIVIDSPVRSTWASSALSRFFASVLVTASTNAMSRHNALDALARLGQNG